MRVVAADLASDDELRTSKKLPHHENMSMNKPLLAAFGGSKDMTLHVVKNLDGSVMVKKA